MRQRATFSLVLILLLVAFAPAQPKPPVPNELPKLIVALPLGVAPGKTSKLIVRGLKIEAATEIHVHDPKSTAKLLAKAKVNVPTMQDPAQVGDSQIEIEVTLPDDYPMGTLSLSVVTPVGESPPYRLLVDAGPVSAEKEPNNSFKQAQAIPFPQSVDGVIEKPLDVDVYRFEGKEGQAVVVEVMAARYGSPLDSFLTLYNAEGQILASNDDHDGSPDSRIEIKLPRDGAYFVSVIDANDQGGPAFAYRLSVRAK